MAVTDEQVATLRAQLAGQADEHRRLLEQLDPAAGRSGYPALVAAGFALATDRRFADASDPGIIKFVGDLRLRGAEIADHLDPAVAERLLRAALSDEDVDDISTETSFRAQLILLAGLIGDEQLDGAGLDRVLADARKLADQWLV